MCATRGGGRVARVPTGVPVLVPVQRYVNGRRSGGSLGRTGIPVGPEGTGVPIIRHMTDFTVCFLFGVVQHVFSCFLLRY